MAGADVSDELRGNSPVMTAKDLLLELRQDVRQISGAVALLSASNLPARVETLESWKNQLAGRMVATAVMLGLGFTLLGLALDHLLLQS